MEHKRITDYTKKVKLFVWLRAPRWTLNSTAFMNGKHNTNNHFINETKIFQVQFAMISKIIWSNLFSSTLTFMPIVMKKKKLRHNVYLPTTGNKANLVKWRKWATKSKIPRHLHVVLQYCSFCSCRNPPQASSSYLATLWHRLSRLSVLYFPFFALNAIICYWKHRFRLLLIDVISDSELYTLLELNRSTHLSEKPASQVQWCVKAIEW